MRTHLLLPLLAALLLATSCVPFVLPTPTPIPTLTPEVFAEIPFTTIDVFARTSMDERALLPTYVGTPEVERTDGQWQNTHSMLELDSPIVFVVEANAPAHPAVAALPSETQVAILATDFDGALVFTLLHSGVGLDAFSFIRRIVLDKEGTRVDVENWYKPNTGGVLPAVTIYPYHVVRLQRSDLPADWTQERYPVRVAVTEITGDLKLPTPTP